MMKHQKPSLSELKDRKKRSNNSSLTWRSWFLNILLLLLVSAFTFSTLRLLFPDGSRQKVIGSLVSSEVYLEDSSFSPAAAAEAVFIEETIIFPEQTLFFLKYIQSIPLFTRDDLDCVYISSNTSSESEPEPEQKLPVISVDDNYSGSQIVRCPLPPRGMIVSLASKSKGQYLPGGGSMLTWDSLAYDALIDLDNTTIVFVKGLNLRGGKLSDTSKFVCVYEKSLDKSKFLLRSNVISIGQEIVRCNTPSMILTNPPGFKVSVRVVGTRTMETVARPEPRFEHELSGPKVHEMCVCTMLRNQAKFLKEWVMYHGHIGVQHWFIYDNNSDDDLENVIKTLVEANYNVTRHVWPWIKSQEAGFSHCALRARGTCRWIGFIDVDEFLHLPSSFTLLDVIRNDTHVDSRVGEIRVPCRSFGPSGLKQSPVEGVTVGYTCRLLGFERHKSIIRPEALNVTLINVVHHFHLRSGYKSINMHSWLMVINHYKYQVWEVFKGKFERRVATYVSDWQHDHNVGSKDRAPGLGTAAIEPPDWSQRFCDIQDTSLRDRVLQTFNDPNSGFLPWQHKRLD